MERTSSWPLVRMLPTSVKPIVVEYPPDGGSDYVDLLDVVSHAVRDAASPGTGMVVFGAVSPDACSSRP